MSLPRALARFNRRATNKVLAPIAARLPGFAIIEHPGRRSGRSHHTPVNLFHHEDRYVVALMYGSDSDWARNVLAHGGCVAHVRGHPVELGDAQLVHDPTGALVPRPVRPILQVIDVTDFLVMRATQPPREPADDAAM